MAEMLTPAADLAATRTSWPGESPEYAAARRALLEQEIDLRRHLERVAAQRRTLPPGPVMRDYRFTDTAGATLTLADLFGAHDTLLSYFWMYGPQRERPCPMCTNFLGPLDQNARDLEEKIAVAVIGRSPVERQRAFARERGWRNLKFYQCADDFPRDFRVLTPEGDEWPSLSVFVKDGDRVRLFWTGEMSGAMADPGQDPRGAPDFAPLWNALDLTPGGRGLDWYPKLDY